ncbi:MAG TPA: CHASE2 domain-containing protein [Cyclobacteriaceae bacterium]|nr:CHASE2 domain-containing protein [Cyclobacteriaceae bacterium]
MKKKIFYQSLAITVFVFVMLWGAQRVTDLKLFAAFDTIGQALSDFQLTDYAFSNLREYPNVDDRFVLVNIGPLDRRGIAQQIQILNSYNPKIIAFDGFFKCPAGLRDSINCPQLLDTLGNLMLESAIADANDFVLGSKLMQTRVTAKQDIEFYDSMQYSDENFGRHATYGFVSLPTNATYQEDVKLCRSIFPKWTVNGQEHLAFSVQIAKRYDSAKAEKFLARGNKEELLNFRGNMEVVQLGYDTEKANETGASRFPTMFSTLDYDQVLRGDFDSSVVKGKIVMMGFMGNYLGAPQWEDKFFTPLNRRVAGRANPDMFGLVVHANAVVMILNEDYINEIPEWTQYLIAFVVCMLTVYLFVYIDKTLPTWFDALSFVIQMVELLLISALVIFAFDLWSLKLELSVALGVSALVGPCYDIFKSLQNEYNKRFTKTQEAV